MASLTRAALVGVAVAAAAVLAVLLLGRSSPLSAPAPATPIFVSAGFAPPATEFGDEVDGRVVVLLDRGVVRPETLVLDDGIAPLTSLGSPRTATATHGRLTVVTVKLPGACLTQPCVARSGDVKLKLPRVTATVTTRDGRTLHASTAWPVLDVHGGVTAADLAPAQPPLRGDTTPPAPAYSVTPSTLAALLDALAVLLVLAGAGLVARELAVRRRRRRAAERPGAELERALVLARQAESRPAPDRRRALGLLARLLGARDGRLAGEASDLAWSRDRPESASLARLVGEIEREVQP
jgi:hypothetical protein